MKLFTKGCVFKSYTVEVSAPRLLEGYAEGFERFNVNSNVAVINADSKNNYDHNTNLNKQVQVLTNKYPSLTGNSEQSVSSEIISDILVEAERKASEKINQAEAHAKRILQEAQIKAGETIRQAEIEAKEIIQHAKEEENLVRDIAHSEGYQKGIRESEREGQGIIEQAKSFFSLAQRALNEEYSKVDEALLKLAIRIAERLARTSLGLKPQQLLEIMRSLMLLPQNREGWRLHVALEDAAWINKLPRANQPPCTWVKNDTLSQGDCFLECQEGIFDARLEVQLERLEKVLREELKHGGLESTGTEG
ncbi:MAG: FliH/SctL family protein [Desulfitobacteriaceae bacterium]